MSNERGSIILAVMILVVGAIIVLWLATDACVSDEGEKKDLGRAPTGQVVAA